MTVGLQAILEEVLGHGTRLSAGEVAYHCPFCHHHKQKLQCNLNTHKYHCWVCNARGKSFFSLFKKVGARKDQFERLSVAVGAPTITRSDQDTKDDFVTLPDGFLSLTEPTTDPFYRNALHYLIGRGITKFDLYRYNIGYCVDGPYANRIIIPSYDANLQLNYFTARSFVDSPLKYKNPEVPKDIIAFESEINWEMPIILVEGVFDAIKAKRNAIPMLGKFLQKSLKDALILNQVQEVTIMLDPDAMSSAVESAEELMEKGIAVRLVEIGDGRDAGDMSYEEINTLISATPIMSFSTFIHAKMKYPRPKGVIWQQYV